MTLQNKLYETMYILTRLPIHVGNPLNKETDSAAEMALSVHMIQFSILT